VQEDNRTPKRYFRMSDEEWEKFLWAMKVRGQKNTSHIMRTVVRQYTEATEEMVRNRRRAGPPNRGANP